MTAAISRFRSVWRAWRQDTRGGATVELALSLVFLTIPLLNVSDVGIYVYRRMQVENAAQAGAQAARSTCNTTAHLPATNTTNCPTFNSVVAAAIKGSSLGTLVTQVTGSPAEGYYCATSTGGLSLVGTAGTVGSPPTGEPLDCSGVTGAAYPSAPPGDYAKISVTYAFTSVFSGVTVASLLPSPITKITWARLN